MELIIAQFAIQITVNAQKLRKILSGLEILQCRCFLNPSATLGIVKFQLMRANQLIMQRKFPVCNNAWIFQHLRLNCSQKDTKEKSSWKKCLNFLSISNGCHFTDPKLIEGIFLGTVVLAVRWALNFLSLSGSEWIF